MTDLELSLDDIIKKRNIRVEGRKPPNFVKRLDAPPNKRFGPPRMQVHPVDARKILHQKRVRQEYEPVVDDARFRLEALRRSKPMRAPMVHPMLRGGIRGRLGNMGNPLLSRSRIPMDVDMYEYEPPRDPARALVRTVDNALPPFSRRPFDWDRPIEEDEDYLAAMEQRDPFRPAFQAPDLNKISITVYRPPTHVPPPQQSILKRSGPAPSSRLRSDLPIPRPHNANYPTLSERFNSGRSAEAAAKVDALKSQLNSTRSEPVAKIEPGYRIVVSNLVPSVTHEDVKELFADIGELVTSKLVKPGVAEVVYHHPEDAAKAVDVYHDRQLDGQPMKCLLVKNNAKSSRPNLVKLDMATLRNAIHKKATS